jgi:hypothetical protein
MRLFRPFGLALPLLAGCAQSEPVNQERAAEDPASTEKAVANEQSRAEIRRYSVMVGLAVCPNPADLHDRIDRLLAGSADAPLPARCAVLKDGTILLAENEGNRPFVMYRDWRIERATLADGSPVWSDDFNEQYLSPAGGQVRG